MRSADLSETDMEVYTVSVLSRGFSGCGVTVVVVKELQRKKFHAI